MNRLIEFFQEADGGNSSMRLVFVLWNAAVIVGWLSASLKSGALAEIPEGVLILSGISFGGKALQKAQERKPCDPVVPST